MIALLFALAVASFVLSLPIAKTNLGAKLRQVAGVCFVLALLPSLIVGLFFPSQASRAGGVPPASTSTPGDQLATGLSCVGALVLLSILAYVVLAVRTRLRKPKKEPWEMFFSRGGGKKRVERDRVEDDPFDLEEW